MIQTDTRLRFLEARSTRKPELFADVVCQGLSAPKVTAVPLLLRSYGFASV